MQLNLSDFKPFNDWIVLENGPSWDSQQGTPLGPKFIQDSSTGKKYLNESKDIIRFKCFLLVFGTSLHCFTTIEKIAKVIMLQHFATCPKTTPIESQEVTDKQRLHAFGKDVLCILLTPLTLLGLEFAALYGLYRPHDGRKLYASIEKLAFDNSYVAPCFQPDPTHHAFGGNIDKKDAF